MPGDGILEEIGEPRRSASCMVCEHPDQVALEMLLVAVADERDHREWLSTFVGAFSRTGTCAGPEADSRVVIELGESSRCVGSLDVRVNERGRLGRWSVRRSKDRLARCPGQESNLRHAP